jgi:type II secretory ATPase GspE/PulE/Tfp pilus assembly ATPase PilB-like protein
MNQHIAHRRQYERHSVDVQVELVIAEGHADQVTPLGGPSIPGRMRNVSAGGALVVVPTYLPRAAQVELVIPTGTPVGQGHPDEQVPAGRVTARVAKVQMVDREPHYSLGLRFENADSDLVRALQAWDGCGPGAPPATGADHRPVPRIPNRRFPIPNPDLPEWIAKLQDADLVGADALQSALRETEHDAQRAGEWLVEHGCIARRDLGIVQAESFGLPFVETGEFRVNLANRALVPEELARVRNVFPLFAIDRVVTLAVAWPLDLPVLDQIRLQTGCEMDQCLVSARELRNLVEWGYGNFQGQEAGRANLPARRSETVAWEEVLKDVSDAPAVKLVNVLLDQAAASQASDVHIDAEEHALRVRFRIDGVLREVPAPPKDLLPAIVSRIKVLAHMDIAESRRPQDGHFKLAVERQELDIRVSTLPSTNGEAVVLRLLHSAGHLLSLEELGMDPQTQQTFDWLIHQPHGMLLVTGPTGSGKTTTLYSALARVDRVRQSIITLEDPVEIRLPQIRQVSINPKAGLTFDAGLRSILRQDPDVIMVGEIRDRETAEIALQAALTGHLVLSTLHTNSAAAAPIRLLDMGAADFLVTSALLGVLAQRLPRRVCRHCAIPLDLAQPLGTDDWGSGIENASRAMRQSPTSNRRSPMNPPSSIANSQRADRQSPLALLAAALADTRPGAPGVPGLVQAVGCKRCGNTGYDGRLGVFELLAFNDDLRRAVMARKDERTLAGLARATGMTSMIEDGLAKVRQGVTTVHELLRVVGHVDWESGVGDWRLSAERPPTQSPTDDPQAQRPAFNVTAYERLLAAWLKSPHLARRPPAVLAAAEK